MRIGLACASAETRRRLDGPMCCFQTENGDEAWRLCCEWFPDVLMVSAALKGIDGRALVERIADRGLAKMPVIVALGPHDFACAAELPLDADGDALRTLMEPICDGEGNVQPKMRLRPGCAEEIGRTLDQMGVPVRLRGRACMERALEWILRDVDLTTNLSRRLYPLVGKDMGIAPGGVERAIRTAVENAWKRSGYEYFGEMVDPEKGAPTVGMFLGQAAEMIRTGRMK